MEPSVMFASWGESWGVSWQYSWGFSESSGNGGFVYYTPQKIKKKIQEVEQQAEAVEQVIEQLQESIEIKAKEPANDRAAQIAAREIEKLRQLIEIELALLIQLRQEQMLWRRRLNALLVLAIASPFAPIQLN